MANIYVLRRRKEKISHRPVALSDLEDDQVLHITRLPRSAVIELLNMIGADIEHSTQRSHAIPAETQLLAALQFYASGSFQWMVGRSCGMSQASVSLAINSVTNALVKRASEFIAFPINQQTLRANKLAFHSVAGFPNVIGAIDCTHIAIKSPTTNKEAFVNRKGIHTINVQGVCDADMKLINIVAKWPGSTHDSFIWRSSCLHRMFEEGHIQDGWLIGGLSFQLFNQIF